MNKIKTVILLLIMVTAFYVGNIKGLNQDNLTLAFICFGIIIVCIIIFLWIYRDEE